MTFWRVMSKARSTRVAIEGSLSGATAFLIGGSPRLLRLDLRLLKLPGVWSMAINNAAVVVEPQAFISMDASKCFNFNIFSNPRILKLLSYGRSFEVVGGKRLCQYPNTVFYDVQDENQMMMSEFCKLEGPLPFWRNTFFTAIAALYQMGVKDVNLIGCTFDTSGGDYAHGKEIQEHQSSDNQVLYDDTVEKLKNLIPMLADEGMIVNTCHEGTKLDGICDYISFEDAISLVVTESTKIEIGSMPHVSEN